MSKQPKPKFKKVKLKQPAIYREIEEEHKKYTPNPRLSKLENFEKEGIEVVLQI